MADAEQDMATIVRCGSVHKLSGVTCHREQGHTGLCRSRAERDARSGSITRTEWMSADGEFCYHVGYITLYPKNAHREG